MAMEHSCRKKASPKCQQVHLEKVIFLSLSRDLLSCEKRKSHSTSWRGAAPNKNIRATFM